MNLEDIGMYQDDWPKDDCPEDDFVVFKPIFDKVKKFIIVFDATGMERTLHSLFSMNDRLEFVYIALNGDVDTYTFLDRLPYKTIREFGIDSRDIPFDKICDVSLTF